MATVRPRVALSLDIQSGIPADEQAQVRRLALPTIRAYRDGGCLPKELSRELLQEMMSFLGCRAVEGRLAGLFFDDLQFDGADTGAVTWGDEIPEDVKAASPVVVIGCGMAGILAGIRLKQAGLPFLIIEKNPGPGGTWWENRYPGARVDIGSHQYCYSFEPTDHWSEFYCQQPELLEYFTAIVEKYDLRPHCQFDTPSPSCVGMTSDARWSVHVSRPDGTEEVIDARFVISAVGSLNIPKLPDIRGMETFSGPSFHSARWPNGLELTGKRFALVGAGASGFQIGPTIAGDVERLTIFQRTAQWIIPNPLYHAAVPPGDRWALRHLPFYGRWYRFIMTFGGIAAGHGPLSGRTRVRGSDGPVGQRRERHPGGCTSRLDEVDNCRTARPEAKVVPDYPALGKRVLQDNGSWLRCLQRPNVELVRAPIARIVPDGVVTVDGTHTPADIICFATGFRHNDFLASMDVTGSGGVSLREQWGDEPTAYLGITIANFPNLFCVYGPGTNLAAGASLFYHSEFQVHYAMEAIRETLTSGARTCEVTTEAHARYAERYQAEIGQMVWSHPSIEHSHYKNPAGKVFTLSPWPLDLYWEWTRHVDGNDYVFA